MRGMERHDDREIGRWRHVAFDDGDGSIQMAVDANTPDERHLDGWVGARHRFALACETADPRAMRDALDAVRDRATRDHILEESLNSSHGGAGYHTPFSESWRLPDILDLALDLFVPRDDEPLWMGLPCMGREDGEATEGAIVDPADLTVAADGSPIPVDPDPADRLCGMAAARAARLLEDDADRIIRVTDTANGMRFGNMDALIRADRMRAQTRAAIRWGLWGMILDILDDARRPPGRPYEKGPRQSSVWRGGRGPWDPRSGRLSCVVVVSAAGCGDHASGHHQADSQDEGAEDGGAGDGHRTAIVVGVVLPVVRRAGALPRAGGRAGAFVFGVDGHVVDDAPGLDGGHADEHRHRRARFAVLRDAGARQEVQAGGQYAEAGRAVCVRGRRPFVQAVLRRVVGEIGRQVACPASGERGPVHAVALVRERVRRRV